MRPICNDVRSQTANWERLIAWFMNSKRAERIRNQQRKPKQKNAKFFFRTKNVINVLMASNQSYRHWCSRNQNASFARYRHRWVLYEWRSIFKPLYFWRWHTYRWATCDFGTSTSFDTNRLWRNFKLLFDICNEKENETKKKLLFFCYKCTTPGSWHQIYRKIVEKNGIITKFVRNLI